MNVVIVQLSYKLSSKTGDKLLSYKNIRELDRFYQNILTLYHFLPKSALKIEERSRRKGGGREKNILFSSPFTANQTLNFFLFNWDI